MLVSQDEIASFAQPVVILGAPGVGKSVLSEQLDKLPGMKSVRAGKFVGQRDPGSLFAGDERPVIDGLDEIASAAPGGAVELVLKQLSAMGDPTFILTCRAADWLGATDRIRIEDHYDEPPALLHLEHFGEDDARAFLAQEFPAIDSASVLEHLERCGIQSLYENPLTLRMLGEVAQGEDPLPETRAQLFDRACRVMLRELNPRHQRDSHARRPEQELLAAAGAVCAAQLICGYTGVYDGPHAETSEAFLNIAEVAAFPVGAAANDALRTRLFVAEEENRFTPVHRVIAEYLGAKWLARCFEQDASEKRIFSLFRQGEGVPTSLRGLHAWIAHFNEILAHRCIEADPYAILRYGDAETLSPGQARALLGALTGLSEDDPYFRSEDWARHSVSGLFCPELREEILAIVDTPDRFGQLRALLLEAMAGTDLAKELSPTLETIMFDPNRDVDERSAAANALHIAAMRGDWERVIDRLLEMNDPDSARLSFEFLRRVGLFGVPTDTSIRILLAYFGLSPARHPEEEIEHRYVPDCLFNNLDTERLASWLDALIEAVQPLIESAHFEPAWYLVRLVKRIATQILEAVPETEPERVWTWIRWMEQLRGHNNDTTKRLVVVFRENRPLRAKLLEHVLLTPSAESTWEVGHRLSDLALGLYPTGRDLAGVLRALRARAGEDRIDLGTWHDILLLGRNTEGLPAILQDTAVEVANGDPELLAILNEVTNPPPPEWETRRAEKAARAEANRQAAYGAHRQLLVERAEEVAAGNVHILATSAAVYLGRSYALPVQLQFDSEASPEQRLREFLGDDLSEQVFSGFVAVLGRDDLPTASEIAQAHAENKHYGAKASMICGVAELLRGGRALDGIDRAAIASAYVAWQRWPEPDSADQKSIGLALEEVLFRSEADWEAHFRTSIEPQLDGDHSHPSELYRLTHEPPFSALAARLSIDWLRRYSTLNLHVQTELLACALSNAPDDQMRELIIEVRDRTHPDQGTELLWMSAEYVVNLEECRPVLETTAAEHRNFIWIVRDRAIPRGGQPFERLFLDHLAFIVEGFGACWPNVQRPTSVTMGDRNPWDASEFIRQTIYEIASLPSPGATEALQGLIERHAQSYLDIAKHALALQQRRRRDHEYSPPTIGELRAVVGNALPESVDDMRAWFQDRIETLQERIRASDTNMWEAYWDGDRPRGEEFCRDRMIEHVSMALPQSIRFGPESRMPQRKRADIALTRNAVKLPVEIKGQWHDDVWNAASDQLDAKYAIDWQAGGRGAYIVLWFGDAPDKQLHPHPEGLDRPRSPEALRRMLIDRLPDTRRAWIDIFVVDVSRPPKTV